MAVLNDEVLMSDTTNINEAKRKALIISVSVKAENILLLRLVKTIYCIQLMIEEAFENRWKLKVVDSVETEDAVPQEEFVKFIDALIQNKQIKDFLMRPC
jgi:hypothetical protein